MMGDQPDHHQKRNKLIQVIDLTRAAVPNEQVERATGLYLFGRHQSYPSNVRVQQARKRELETIRLSGLYQAVDDIVKVEHERQALRALTIPGPCRSPTVSVRSDGIGSSKSQEAEVVNDLVGNGEPPDPLEDPSHPLYTNVGYVVSIISQKGDPLGESGKGARRPWERIEERLQPGVYLDDEVINFFLEILTHQSLTRRLNHPFIGINCLALDFVQVQAMDDDSYPNWHSFLKSLRSTPGQLVLRPPNRAKVNVQGDARSLNGAIGSYSTGEGGDSRGMGSSIGHQRFGLVQDTQLEPPWMKNHLPYLSIPIPDSTKSMWDHESQIAKKRTLAVHCPLRATRGSQSTSTDELRIVGWLRRLIKQVTSFPSAFCCLPVNDKAKVHWTLVIIRFSTLELWHYDPLHPGSSKLPRMLACSAEFHALLGAILANTGRAHPRNKQTLHWASSFAFVTPQFPGPQAQTPEPESSSSADGDPTMLKGQRSGIKLQHPRLSGSALASGTESQFTTAGF
jgi:hypothetical protein